MIALRKSILMVGFVSMVCLFFAAWDGSPKGVRDAIRMKRFVGNTILT